MDKYISEDAFESVSRSYLWEALEAKRLPKGLVFDRVGSWWTGRGGTQDEADVVAYDGKQLTLIGECKWTNSPASTGDLAGIDKILREFPAELSPATKVWRALFCRSGFDSDLRRRAKDSKERLLLIEPADMYW